MYREIYMSKTPICYIEKSKIVDRLSGVHDIWTEPEFKPQNRTNFWIPKNEDQEPVLM